MPQNLEEYIDNKILIEGDEGRHELLAAWTSIIMNQIVTIPDDMEVTNELIKPWGMTLAHALINSAYEPEEIEPVSSEILRLLELDYEELVASKLLDQLDDDELDNEETNVA